MLNPVFARAVLVVLLAICAPPAIADDSTELAKKGRALWSAFVCAALASRLDISAEQERLFEYGYEEGRTFIEAIRSGKITRQDIDEEVPVVVVLSLKGPSTDFMLGRIYELAVDDALDAIWGDDDAPHDYETRQLLARSKFDKFNCRLIGDNE